MYSSQNSGVINIYFEQIDDMTNDELENYMKEQMPADMKKGLEEIDNTNISISSSIITVNGKEFPSCRATYEYEGENVGEIVFAKLTDQGVMIVDICAFKEMNTSQIIDQMIVCK